MSAGTFPSTVAPSLWCYLLATGTPSSESLGHARSSLFLKARPKQKSFRSKKPMKGNSFLTRTAGCNQLM